MSPFLENIPIYLFEKLDIICRKKHKKVKNQEKKTDSFGIGLF